MTASVASAVGKSMSTLFLTEPLKPNCMLGPYKQYERGTPEWAEALAGWIITDYTHATRTSEAERLVEDLQEALREKPYPWDVWPTVGAPNARLWFDRLLMESGWDQHLGDVLARHSPELHAQISSKLALAKAEAGLGLAEHGAIGRGRTEENRGADRTSKRGSESQSYLLPRLARDRPDLLDQIGPDKPYRSVRAAAIEAGIVKDAPTVRLSDPAKAAAAIRSKMPPAWVDALQQALNEISHLQGVK